MDIKAAGRGWCSQYSRDLSWNLELYWGHRSSRRIQISGDADQGPRLSLQVKPFLGPQGVPGVGGDQQTQCLVGGVCSAKTAVNRAENGPGQTVGKGRTH